MRCTLLAAFIGLGVLVVGPAQAHAQAPEWNPPSRDMPPMPRMAELQGDWQGAAGAWFAGVEQVSGVPADQLRATGEAKPGSDRAQLVRFTSGPLPIAVWTDRNGDERADLIELYRDGTIVVQLIDANYDGQADVLRSYGASGALLHERRL